ncbi:MAG: hypothetical protein E7266_09945 [Lachnospiraceae bacterium]|nr:hypothetical protein [Lachnospiraceae bacterium]
MAKDKKKKKKRNNQDVVSLFIFFTVIVMVALGLAWLDRSANPPERFEGSGTSPVAEEEFDYDGILTVASIASGLVFVVLVAKKAVNVVRKKRIEREKKEKLKELILMTKQKPDDNIVQILAAGRRTIDSRNYHKNFYRTYEQREDVIDVKEERMRALERNEKLSDMLDDYMYEDYHKKNIQFYIMLGAIVFIAVTIMVAILLF